MCKMYTRNFHHQHGLGFAIRDDPVDVIQGTPLGGAYFLREHCQWAVLHHSRRGVMSQCGSWASLMYKLQVYKFKFDLQPGSLTDQVAGEHQPSYKHP